MTAWRAITDEYPPRGETVDTCIMDTNGSRRNEQALVFERNLWWFPDRSMYVYYAPTHWRPLA